MLLKYQYKQKQSNNNNNKAVTKLSLIDFRIKNTEYIYISGKRKQKQV
jgi:hypothetical protein